VIGSGTLGELSRVVDKALLGMSQDGKCTLACASDYVYKGAGHGVVSVELHLQQMYSVSDVSLLKDKTVMKKVLKDGEGYDKPQDGSKVSLKVEAATDDAGAPLVGFVAKDLSFEAGSGQVCDALECAVREMKQGERALVTCTAPSKAREGQLGLGESTAAKTLLTCELLEFVKEKETFSLDSAEKLGLARKRKLDGGALFSAKRFELALEKYKKVVDAVADADTYEAEHKAPAVEVKRTAELNKAACFLKVGDLNGALESCDKVLKEDKSNVKALFRRARVRHERTDHTEAIKDLRRVLELDPKNAEARALFLQVKKAQKAVDRTAQGTFAKMCRGLGKLGADSRTMAARAGEPDPEEMDEDELGEVHKAEAAEAVKEAFKEEGADAPKAEEAAATESLKEGLKDLKEAAVAAAQL